MSGKRKTLGVAGEAAAAAYLSDQGFSILERNWRCRNGETDLIARKGETLIFVEVRSRSEQSLHAFGLPLESITPKKQRTMRRVAEAYLQQHPEYRQFRVRFDCIGIVWNEKREAADIRHVADAF